MALEMFAGKTGERLIARLPVEDGSYADVVVSTPWDIPATIRLSYEGGHINGYPALSPTLESLEQLFSGASALISAKRAGFAHEADKWERIARSASTAMEQDPSAHLQALFTKWRAEDAATYLRKLGPKAPICPRVMASKMLQLRLPTMYGKIAAVDLGEVQKITIVNA